MNDYDVRCAKNMTEYLAAWRWHIGQLSVLALKAEVPYAEFKRVTDELDGWLADAQKNILERVELE